MIEPPLEPTTTRIGGRSARGAAVLAAAVLVAFVYVGVTGPGRPPAPTIVPRPVAATSPAPSRTPRIGRVQPRPAVEHIRLDARSRPYQFLGVILNLGTQGYIADLDEIEPGHWTATYRMLAPLPARSATVQLADMTTTVSHDTWTLLGSWPVELDAMLGQLPTAGNWQEAVQAPKPNAHGPELARMGYRISFRTESRAGFGLLTVEVRAPAPAARHDHGVRLIFDVLAGE